MRQIDQNVDDKQCGLTNSRSGYVAAILNWSANNGLQRHPCKYNTYSLCTNK